MNRPKPLVLIILDGWGFRVEAKANAIVRGTIQRYETDIPIGGLLTDLKQRGLLDSTLVIWGGEFGRLPVAQRPQNTQLMGRDHNPHAFTTWFAGGGVKGGVHFGETDELGHKAAVDRVPVHDLHATILHLLGMDHLKLTYRHNGRDFRLTDVYGNVVQKILA